jgi:UrcA family protein
MRSRRLYPVFAVALAAGLTPAVHASAQGAVAPLTVHAPPVTGTEVKTESIKVADLDLTSDAGAETLVGRIRGAAGRICMPRPTAKGNFKDVSDYEKCKANAIESAVKDSGSAKAAEVLKRTGD